MQKPNIVFIHVDQLHHRAISAYGCKYVHTPNLDEMASKGFSFMESYCSMPQCCPSRASWFTGRMSKEHGVVVNSYPMAPALPDLGQWLRKYGYETVHTGKWHVSGRNVADSFKVLHRGSGHGELGDSTVARSAVAYLRNRRGNQPFFLSVGFLNPHDCCFPASSHGGPGKFAFAAKIRDKLPPLPANFDHEYDKTGTPRVRNWSTQDWRYYIYSYYRMVEMVDREVGRLYDAVRNSPLAENTLLIFTSDHGDGLGYHAKVSKGYLEEEASRVPAIVCWPGVVKQEVHDGRHLVSAVDIAATICDYAGAPPLPKMTIARSWRPLLEGKETKWRDYVICETSIGPLSVCVRETRFKSIIYEDRTKLYDIRNDPLETNDLAGDPRYALAKKRHRDQFREYLSRIEIYPGPAGIEEEIARQRRFGRRRTSRARYQQGNLYEAYVNWYERVKAEV
ncbi:MAG: sulfatase-like hydrolase/transferase [Phycisphaerales bacterium]|nr:MAG: sulfatase-like hydrolase/transferase [Phycisphaerales bacterium]